MKLLHLQLFWYEKHHTLLEMEDLPLLTPRQESELRDWLAKRRKLLSYEVHAQPWVRINIDGFSSTLTLKPNGQVEEQDLFSKSHIHGIWKMMDGFLFIKVVSGEFIVEYHVVGNAETNIHCGIEYINGRVSTYSKFMQLRPNK